MFTGLPGTRGCSRVLTVYGIETYFPIAWVQQFVYRCSRVLTVYGIETSCQPISDGLFHLAAVGYLPFTVLKRSNIFDLRHTR